MVSTKPLFYRQKYRPYDPVGKQPALIDWPLAERTEGAFFDA
jgi:hypothetical protein